MHQQHALAGQPDPAIHAGKAQQPAQVPVGWENRGVGFGHVSFFIDIYAPDYRVLMIPCILLFSLMRNSFIAAG
ncbi:hypothetical protein [Kerstersia gyiorum]|uniref:hypothetical protein n=1 Tax=Kerstersia gyiorum TaxID=206506 RepID=UPI001F111529|nr:hypothetical protein [Kerstersia gyiorum]MCP1634437.1 hypothetical protein [Kerstersia gyiorum]MCP1636039.1 hypothetical protein [Kerstersia gyiorum]MCP1672269.1 hypothetical protein [Kerstersia gyiorum]MCP1680241.1 hypothetical protein [Kerstersia gyiorum]MCP1681752.1 hypothetical protein [Kerstersia gyiorum]